MKLMELDFKRLILYKNRFCRKYVVERKARLNFTKTSIFILKAQFRAEL